MKNLSVYAGLLLFVAICMQQTTAISPKATLAAVPDIVKLSLIDIPSAQADFARALQDVKSKTKFPRIKCGKNKTKCVKAALGKMEVLLTPVQKHILSTSGVLAQSLAIGIKVGILPSSVRDQILKVLAETNDVLKFIDELEKLTGK